jgi:hypothetical protein
MFSNTPETTKSQSSWMPSKIFNTVRVDSRHESLADRHRLQKHWACLPGSMARRSSNYPPDVIPSSCIIIVMAFVEQNLL